MKAYDAWGSAQTYPHMSVAWSWAFDTPFKWTKQVASHFGGTRQGMVIAWPGHIKDAGGIRTQFHHMIDIVPTILEATGIQAPQMVNGIAQKPIEGVSMAYTFDKANANAPSTRTTQYFEMFANRAIYHDGWIAATTPPAPPWLLGHGQDARVSQRLQMGTLQPHRGLFGGQRPRRQNPDKLREMQQLSWWRRRSTMCFRSTTRSATRIAPRPSATAGRDPLHLPGEMSGLPISDAPSILNKSYTITADMEVPQGGAEGMINTLGGRFGGYGLYLLKGKPVFPTISSILSASAGKAQEALAPGKHTVVFDFTYDGPGFGKGGTGVLKVDGKEVAEPERSRTPCRSS